MKILEARVWLQYKAGLTALRQSKTPVLDPIIHSFAVNRMAIQQSRTCRFFGDFCLGLSNLPDKASKIHTLVDKPIFKLPGFKKAL
ncbi:MAG: hypothetical protein BVN35_19505 [Proteobacteria bacterium ST_bin11]|nr:MAG: hypothetical protein BVN35_19505 [Proteobacteria bacterium ST_bin11]